MYLYLLVELMGTKFDYSQRNVGEYFVEAIYRTKMKNVTCVFN